MQMRALVTGGAGFIGSALVLRLINDGHEVLNLDLLTYAGSSENLSSVADSPGYTLLEKSITDKAAVEQAFLEFDPDTVFHLAAESHVDRSIDGPSVFIDTNIVGTFVMLEAALKHSEKRPDLKFLHVSTDEVYGALGKEGLFTEATPYAPNSPYSASKAAADHLVRAWVKTYGLQAYISNCSNNYGPRQHFEKLIPTIIRNATGGKPIPIYGDGKNVRDWLYVDDHVDAMMTILEKGAHGEKYNIGGDNEIPNIDIATTICSLLDTHQPRTDAKPYSDQITFVTDRPGHDFRYAIDPTKVQTELGWSPSRTFETGIEETVLWYLDNSKEFAAKEKSTERLGLNRTGK